MAKWKRLRWKGDNVRQAIMDGGRWDTAWMMMLLEEPSPQVMHRRPQPPGVRAFSRLADQAWAMIRCTKSSRFLIH